jgi:hypothetical protein
MRNFLSSANSTRDILHPTVAPTLNSQASGKILISEMSFPDTFARVSVCVCVSAEKNTSEMVKNNETRRSLALFSRNTRLFSGDDKAVIREKPEN